MGTRWRRLLSEAGRFLAVGGLATLVALFLFNFLVHGLSTSHRPWLGDHVYIAYVLANTVGMMVSYRGSRSWAFRDRPPRHADGGRAAFVAINLLTMLLPIGCLLISRKALGLDDPVADNVSANVIGLFLGLVARFYLFRTLVFRRPVTLPHLPHVAQVALPHRGHAGAGDVAEHPADRPVNRTANRAGELSEEPGCDLSRS